MDRLRQEEEANRENEGKKKIDRKSSASLMLTRIAEKYKKVKKKQPEGKN